MAIKKIVQIGDEVLRKVSAPVEKIDENILKLLEDIKDTLIFSQGAGLAAPQIGVNLRVFAINIEEGYFEFINPVILKTSGKQFGPEGCLSVQHKQGDVERPNKVVVKYQDRNGDWFKLTAYDFFARAICHENDHLDGVLYIDKAQNLKEIRD